MLLHQVIHQFARLILESGLPQGLDGIGHQFGIAVGRIDGITQNRRGRRLVGQGQIGLGFNDIEIYHIICQVTVGAQNLPDLAQDLERGGRPARVQIQAGQPEFGPPIGRLQFIDPLELVHGVKGQFVLGAIIAEGDPVEGFINRAAQPHLLLNVAVGSQLQSLAVGDAFRTGLMAAVEIQVQLGDIVVRVQIERIGK